MFTQGRDKGLRERCRNRGSLYNRDNARLSPHLSVITLGCLDEGDKRGGGQGLLLKSTRLRARYRYRDKVEKRDETSVSTGSAGQDLNTLEQGGQDY